MEQHPQWGAAPHGSEPRRRCERSRDDQGGARFLQRGTQARILQAVHLSASASTGLGRADEVRRRVTGAKPKVHRGLLYAEPGSELQTLDVYAPVEGKNLPVIVWIHGGGWHRGDKSEMDKKPQAMVDKGFVFVSVNYRLFPAVTIKQIAADVAKAIRWTRDHIREYGGDPSAIVVMGHSAGAQLAALVCIDDRYLKAEGIPLSAIKACVPVDGDSYDLPMQLKAVEEGPAASYTLDFGDPTKLKKLPTITILAKGKRAASIRIKFGDEALQKDLSAVTHAAKGKNIPPFLVLHVADHPETKAQSQRLVKALVKAGVKATVYPAAGKNHTTINADLGLPDDGPTGEIFTFFGRRTEQTITRAGLAIDFVPGWPATVKHKTYIRSSWHSLDASRDPPAAVTAVCPLRRPCGHLACFLASPGPSRAPIFPNCRQPASKKLRPRRQHNPARTAVSR